MTNKTWKTVCHFVHRTDDIRGKFIENKESTGNHNKQDMKNYMPFWTQNWNFWDDNGYPYYIGYKTHSIPEEEIHMSKNYLKKRLLIKKPIRRGKKFSLIGSQPWAADRTTKHRGERECQQDPGLAGSVVYEPSHLCRLGRPIRLPPPVLPSKVGTLPRDARERSRIPPPRDRGSTDRSVGHHYAGPSSPWSGVQDEAVRPVAARSLLPRHL
jgi:hypothetical protein